MAKKWKLLKNKDLFCKMRINMAQISVNFAKRLNMANQGHIYDKIW